MATQTHVPALATLGAAAGAAIGRHLDRAFRALVSHSDRTEGSQSLQLLTGEPHPFGNFAVVSSPADLNDARDVIDPLVARGVPAAVLFPDIDVPASVDAYLTASGFTMHPAMPAMSVDIAHL